MIGINLICTTSASTGNENKARFSPRAYRYTVLFLRVPEAGLADLEWADGLIFGTPTRYGLPAAQLKQFLDTTGPLWAQGKLVDKVVSSFTSSATTHGGQESTLLALNNTFYHWGSILVAPGFIEPIQFQSGNPYGVSFTSQNGTLMPDDIALTAARF